MRPLLLLAALVAAPALAQHEHHAEEPPAAADPHAGHATPAPQGPHTEPAAPSQDVKEESRSANDLDRPRSAPDLSDPHAGHAMTEAADPHAGHVTTSPPPDETPPPAALSGPRHAADAIWGAAAMAPARVELENEHGGGSVYKVMLERLEYRARGGRDGYLWDGQAWYGGDIDKLWLKSEGEGAFGEPLERAEIQALWSHAIGPWFDLQAGARFDLEPRSRAYAVLGLQGLAPYMFEVDAAAFLSDEGDLTARVEAEYDQLITQRLILQPRAELVLAARDVPELGIGDGFSSIEAGLRLRYEFAREFAPYVGVGWERRLGDAADFARAEGDDPDSVSLLIGLRAWF